MAIDFLRLAQQNMLTFDDAHEHYYVKPIDRHNFITYPLEDLSGTVMVTVDEYLGLRAAYYQFSEDLTGIEVYEPELEVENEVVENNVTTDEYIDNLWADGYRGEEIVSILYDRRINGIDTIEKAETAYGEWLKRKLNR